MSDNGYTALTTRPNLGAQEFVAFEPADSDPATALDNFYQTAKAAGIDVFSAERADSVRVRHGRRRLGTIRVIGQDALHLIQAAAPPGQPENTPTAIRLINNPAHKLDATLLVNTTLEVPDALNGTTLAQVLYGTWMDAAARQLATPPPLRRISPVAKLVADGTNRYIGRVHTTAGPLMLMATSPLTPGGQVTIIARRFHVSDEELFEN